jgi:hypothetical protein
MTTVNCKQQAVQRLTDSLNINIEINGAWCPPNREPIEFLTEKEHELKASFIEPYKVKIIPDRSTCKLGDWEERPYEMFVLAKLKNKNGYDALFMNTETGLFSLGWINGDGRAGIIGYASDSALAEWVD